ncbi:hypothetical protein P153DRAFT_428514 [Dothidotthia symphoricarpi CBS 119687]|uniref:Uncharacterized protein n=1 Tax=Dothidotthia symphoricarpi CBS 119687 TaxID=1392245 RepID=A0A6A6AP48_9PLEO|nr:uncharacterized protein P153DRAFT_428514 [Dothidotthia symphoricarpi CBS 119687]KAF2133570.1 hypothetical protein P153DRAFT_428514 [Dothidotthia symphoricarpi CBS 119687]
MPLSMHIPGLRKKSEVAYHVVEAGIRTGKISGKHAQIPDWPSEPRRIERTLLWIFADFALLTLPIAFIVLAILASGLDGQPTSRLGKDIQNASLLGPTIFPLAFAALGGRSLKNIALWNAERGTTLGVLELLVGSRSFVAAVGHAINLRSPSLLAFGILILWTLSPLGGQSALRLVSETNRTISVNGPVYYANVDAWSGYMVVTAAWPDNVNTANSVSATVSMSLLTSKTWDNSSFDVWSHPKVPRIEDLERDEAENQNERPWYIIDRSTPANYASLTGVPILNLEVNVLTNLTIPYEYMYFDCSKKMDESPDDEQHDVPTYLRSLVPNLYGPNLNTLVENNSTSFVDLFTASAGGFEDYSSSFFLYGTRSENNNRTYAVPDRLLYGTINIDTRVFLYECSMKSVLTEINVVCLSDDCVVERVRRLDKPRNKRGTGWNNEYNGTPYDVMHDNITNARFFQYFTTIAPVNSNPHPIDSYVYGATPWGEGGFRHVASPHEWDNVSTIDISNRLTRVLNTYWDTSRWSNAVTRNDFFTKPTFLNSTSSEDETWGYTNLNMNITNAQISHQILIYEAHFLWVAASVVCSTILFLLGTFSFFLSLTTTAPDIFDYVSSFTRDNPHIIGLQGGSSLDGGDRARLLRNLPVQLGDVDADAKEGYIALRSIEGERDCQRRRVQKGRLYR